MRKTEISGLVILFIGVALLIFTFLNAYWFLAQEIGLIATGDLVKAFGEALAPLIATCIRIMYLGIMGWIGSLLTLRGISLLKQKESTPQVKVEKKPQQKPIIVTSTKKTEKVEEAPKKEASTKPQETETKLAIPPPQEPSEPPKSIEQPKPVEEKKEESPAENVAQQGSQTL